LNFHFKTAGTDDDPLQSRTKKGGKKEKKKKKEGRVVAEPPFLPLTDAWRVLNPSEI